MDDEAVGNDFEMSEPDAFVEPPSSVDKGAYATALPPPPPERALRMAASRGFAPDDLDLATGAVDDEVAEEFEVSEEEEEEAQQAQQVQQAQQAQQRQQDEEEAEEEPTSMDFDIAEASSEAEATSFSLEVPSNTASQQVGAGAVADELAPAAEMKAEVNADRATPLPPPPPERALKLAASRGFAPDDLDLATASIAAAAVPTSAVAVAASTSITTSSGAVDEEVAAGFEVSEAEEEQEPQGQEQQSAAAATAAAATTAEAEAAPSGAPAPPARSGSEVAQPAPPRYAAQPPLDPTARQQLREVSALRASLSAQLGGAGGGGALGPLAHQLRELAGRQSAAARYRQKHTPKAERGVASESLWWDCLLDSLGLTDVQLSRLTVP